MSKLGRIKHIIRRKHFNDLFLLYKSDKNMNGKPIKKEKSKVTQLMRQQVSISTLVVAASVLVRDEWRRKDTGERQPLVSGWSTSTLMLKHAAYLFEVCDG